LDKENAAKALEVEIELSVFLIFIIKLRKATDRARDLRDFAGLP
jgi:hypothetical protein